MKRKTALCLVFLITLPLIAVMIAAAFTDVLWLCALSGAAAAVPLFFLPSVFSNEKKKSEEREKELYKRLDIMETSVGNVSEGVVILNAKGCVAFVNSVAAALLSVKLGDDLVSVTHSPALRDLINRAIDTRHAETGIILEGNEYELIADAVFEKGALKSVALLILREDEKEKSALIRREFTANVSHELKTPLHAISGYAELLKNDMVRPEDKDRFLSNIYSEAQRLVDLIDDTIKLSRLDEGASDMAREEVDLYKIAERTLSLLNTKAERAGISLSLSGSSCVMTGIPQLLEGIVFNLVDNAIKYNRENGSVSVEIKETDKSVTLNVCDTGIGIPEEYRERVFERFYRVDKSHSKEVGGTGLGLSIVKHAAKLHQAHIELYSVVQGGTSVSVIFPK